MCDGTRSCKTHHENNKGSVKSSKQTFLYFSLCGGKNTRLEKNVAIKGYMIEMYLHSISGINSFFSRMGKIQYF